MTLRYDTESADLLKIKSKLRELTLAIRAISEPGTVDVILVDGTYEFVGLHHIMDHLAEIEAELDQWYYCGCGSVKFSIFKTFISLNCLIYTTSKFITFEFHSKLNQNAI